MHTLVRKTLEMYINEKRIISQGDIPLDMIPMMSKKEAVFVTLYQNGRVIASSGRIQCQKENVVYECIDNTLLCLKDPRCIASLAESNDLSQIHIRVDTFGTEDRRMIQSISELSVRDEGIILLSQNLGILSIILPRMIYIDPSPEKYYQLACQKAGLDPAQITSSDYILYAFRTRESTDMI